MEASKSVSPILRRTSAILGDSSDDTPDNILEQLGIYGSRSSKGVAKEKYQKEIEPYKDENRFSDLTEKDTTELLRRAKDKTPRTLMNASDVVKREMQKLQGIGITEKIILLIIF